MCDKLSEVITFIKDLETLKKEYNLDKYYILNNRDGCFVFTDDTLFFQTSGLRDKEFEIFPFFKDYYFKFKKKFLDYAVISCENKIFMLCLFDNKKIKPLSLHGRLSGDIGIYYNTKVTDFHYTCGHAILNKKEIKIVKYFKEDINGYQLQNFKGDSYKGIY